MSESDCLKSLLELFSKPSVPREDCVRLLLMFALRYEGSEASLKRLVRAISNDEEDDLEDLIDRMLRCMGSRKRTGDLFSNKTYGAVCSVRALRDFASSCLRVFVSSCLRIGLWRSIDTFD